MEGRRRAPAGEPARVRTTEAERVALRPESDAGACASPLTVNRPCARLLLLGLALTVIAVDEPPAWLWKYLPVGALAPDDSGVPDAGSPGVVESHARSSAIPVPSVLDAPFPDGNILPRAAWRATPLSGTTGRLVKPWRITVHHSGGAALTAEDFSGTSRLLRAIQRDHRERRGWVDIAYHYVVDRAGRVWEGRPSRWIGAHAGSSEANEGNLGILVLGNFDEQRPSSRQFRALNALLESLRRRYGIDRENVFTHAEVRETHGLAVTECPGRNLAGWVDRYRFAERRPDEREAGIGD